MSRRASPPSPPCGGGDGGVLSLEFAMVVPVLFVLVLALFAFTGAARDALAVQNAAREGVRAAATHAGDAEVRRVVSEALDGRSARTTVVPRVRRAGGAVTVRVETTGRYLRLDVSFAAQATARVEPAR